MLVLVSVLSAKEAVFVKLELRLRLVLDNNEVLLAKLKLRLRLAFANKEVLFAKFFAYGSLSLISKNGFVSDSSFAISSLSSRNFQPQRTTSLRIRASPLACSHLEAFGLELRFQLTLISKLSAFHLRPLTSHL